FSGARGISVVNAGSGVFVNDFVAENEQAGIKVETTMPGPTPAAQLRGVALVCNHKVVAGTCLPDLTPCAHTSDCQGGCIYPPAPAGSGVTMDFGLSDQMDLCSAGGCANPIVDLGTGGRDAGRNAFAQNPRPSGGGVNLNNQLAPAAP